MESTGSAVDCARFASRFDAGNGIPCLQQRAWWGCCGLLAVALAGCGALSSLVGPSQADVARLVDRARAACEQGNNEQARELLTKAAEIAPNDAEAHRRIGRGLLQAGSRDAAIKHLRYALRQEGDDPDEYIELARLLIEARRYDECNEIVDSALAIVPGQLQAQLLKGRLAELRNHDEEALEVYYRLLGENPGDVDIMQRVADVLVRDDHLAEAAPLLRTVVESDRPQPSDRARAQWTLGVIYAREHRWSDSAEQLAAAAAARPHLTPDDCYQVAYAFWQSGDLGKCHEYVNQALALDPKHRDALILAAAWRAKQTASQTSYSRPPLPAPAEFEHAVAQPASGGYDGQTLPPEKAKETSTPSASRRGPG